MNIKNSHYYIQFKYVLLTIIGILSFFAFHQIAHASYQQTFIISAYYSPIAGQAKYVTGSYEGDIRLNGSGVNSADGTPVYPGMIAAPSTYAFGTKMNIPGIGVVAVHDRGGAIVNAGVRGQAYDRLDVWMGYGDQGLTRALNWGKRTVTVTVYGLDPSIKENVYLEGFTEAEKFIRTIVNEQKIFKDDLWYGESGDKVGELQEYLQELGYYKGTIDNYYGDEVYKAVTAFQLEQGIIDRDEEFGAGYFGPKTRSKIEGVIEQRRKDKIPRQNLGKDDTGDEVKKLQEALEELGYDVEVNGVYDQKTIDAVFQFQKDNEIIETENDLGAGYFGPKTLAVLSQKIDEVLTPEEADQQNVIVQADYNAFTADLQLGDKGDEVKRLQEELRKFNLLRIEPTGYYGEVTQNAVLKFQQRKGIIADRNSSGAGVFGPNTRNTLNNLLGYRANTKQIIATKTAEYHDEKRLIAENPEKVEEQPIEEIVEEVVEKVEEKPKLAFSSDLGLGSRSDDVAVLQSTLKSLGYFSGSIMTDYFGDKTLEAVIEFQKSQGIIGSETDQGAGYVGPQTRDALNALI